ncbi:MAG: ATP-binding cassette domain-containing protein [Chloroflexi bacterium]|nr:ATP-binding cassette domain-containing protein [Chloroflexota bacterium]
MPAEAVVSLRSAGVTFSSGPPWDRASLDAVRAVDLDIHRGETVGLVGESGSGKTTLGRLCLGMQQPSRGAVLVDGVPFDGHRGRLRGRLQIVGQHPEWALNPRLRVGTSVAEPMAIMGIGTRAEHRQRVGEMLELVGLESTLARRFPHQLSGGQRQRVAIARSLITNPSFIVFDEVVSALDMSVQAQILNLIKDIQAARDFAALFISHDLAAVRYVAHRVAVMLDGDILEIAPSECFYGRPDHPYSRQLQAAIT